MGKNNIFVNSAYLVCLLLLVPVVEAQSIDKQIDNKCGEHPVFGVVKKYKSEFMDSEIISRTKKCASGKASLDLVKWLNRFFEGDAQGCLENENEYTPEYLSAIQEGFNTLIEQSKPAISLHNECSKNIRSCGRPRCDQLSSAELRQLDGKWKIEEVSYFGSRVDIPLRKKIKVVIDQDKRKLTSGRVAVFLTNESKKPQIKGSWKYDQSESTLKVTWDYSTEEFTYESVFSLQELNHNKLTVVKRSTTGEKDTIKEDGTIRFLELR